MTDSSTRRSTGWPQWPGFVLTALIAVLAISVQWGVVTTKLDHVEKRLDELILEARAVRGEYQSLERRMSLLERRVHAGGSE